MFLYLVPLILVAVVMLCFVDEQPLTTAIDRDEELTDFDVDLLTGESLDESVDAGTEWHAESKEILV